MITPGSSPAAVPSDGATPGALAQIAAALQLYNGVSLDRQYNNIQVVLAPSAARTVQPAIATQAAPNHRGILLFLNITASPANVAANLTLSLLALDPVSGTQIPLFVPTAVSATGVSNAVTGLYVTQFFVGAPSTAAMVKGGAFASASGILPRVWTASVVPSTADSWTYSLAAALTL